MKVKIIPPHGSDRSALDERGWAEMSEGSTVYDALRLVRCHPMKARFLLVSVNGERCELGHRLHEGDVVGFLLPLTGG